MSAGFFIVGYVGKGGNKAHVLRGKNAAYLFKARRGAVGKRAVRGKKNRNRCAGCRQIRLRVGMERGKGGEKKRGKQKAAVKKHERVQTVYSIT